MGGSGVREGKLVRIHCIKVKKIEFCFLWFPFGYDVMEVSLYLNQSFMEHFSVFLSYLLISQLPRV